MLPHIPPPQNAGDPNASNSGLTVVLMCCLDTGAIRCSAVMVSCNISAIPNFHSSHTPHLQQSLVRYQSVHIYYWEETPPSWIVSWLHIGTSGPSSSFGAHKWLRKHQQVINSHGTRPSIFLTRIQDYSGTSVAPVQLPPLPQGGNHRATLWLPVTSWSHHECHN